MNNRDTAASPRATQPQMILKCGPDARAVLIKLLGAKADEFLACDHTPTHIDNGVVFTWRGYRCEVYQNRATLKHPDHVVGAFFHVDRT